MIEYVLTAFILIFLTVLYKFYIRPKRIINRLVRQFQKSGYKVYKFPYNPFSLSFFNLMLKDSKKGDPFSTYKQKFHSYDILVGNTFSSPAFTALSPQARKQFVKNEIDYSYQKLPFVAKAISQIAGRGLVFAEGDQWKRKRRIVSKFFTFEFIASKIPQINKICQQTFNQVEDRSLINSDKKQYKYNLIDLTSKIFSKVIMSLFLGLQSINQTINGIEVSQYMIKLVIDFMDRRNQPLMLLLGERYMKLGLTKVDRDINARKKAFDKWALDYIDEFIQKMKSNQDVPPNLLKLLYDPKSSAGQAYSKQELLDELKVFMFAGTDTTSHFLQMMIYLTNKTQQIKKQSISQISKIEQIKGFESLKQMKYLEAIQKQTLRYYGPLPVVLPRVCIKSHYYNGVLIEKGTISQIHSMPTHFNPTLYNEPYKFRPQRWLNQCKDSDAANLIGFGMGPRSCIGQNLALVESKIGFYNFMKRYQKIQIPQNVLLKWKFMNQAQNLWVKVTKNQTKIILVH